MCSSSSVRDRYLLMVTKDNVHSQDWPPQWMSWEEQCCKQSCKAEDLTKEQMRHKEKFGLDSEEEMLCIDRIWYSIRLAVKKKLARETGVRKFLSLNNCPWERHLTFNSSTAWGWTGQLQFCFSVERNPESAIYQALTTSDWSNRRHWEITCFLLRTWSVKTFQSCHITFRNWY